MKLSKFTLVFLLTIIIVRLFLYFIPRTSTLYTDEFHHIYIGIALLVIYFFLKHKEFSKYILAVTLGLIADQISALPFYLAYLINKPLTSPSFWAYWSPYSQISTLIVIIISVIIIEKKLGD
ncbi:MAG: hypothetical protein CMH63_02090 [Nanoarchaeota archaeon]|jgi:hypothetical protein|nr:hypothetical protein [Nanoarchaeota archaeon]|tara:strand:+ start:27430 stop:27795 length:366 start_codon:yes stop_codon:yes gene_type:complete